jgi:hypothetical protein
VGSRVEPGLLDSTVTRYFSGRHDATTQRAKIRLDTVEWLVFAAKREMRPPICSLAHGIPGGRDTDMGEDLFEIIGKAQVCVH